MQTASPRNKLRPCWMADPMPHPMTFYRIIACSRKVTSVSLALASSREASCVTILDSSCSLIELQTRSSKSCSASNTTTSRTPSRDIGEKSWTTFALFYRNTSTSRLNCPWKPSRADLPTRRFRYPGPIARKVFRVSKSRRWAVDTYSSSAMYFLRSYWAGGIIREMLSGPPRNPNVKRNTISSANGVCPLIRFL